MKHWVLEAIVVLLVVLFLWLLSGCTAAPTMPTADIAVPVPIDCKYPDPGPKPDLTAAAALTKDSAPQQVITVISQALAALAEDDQRLRALMNHGN